MDDYFELVFLNRGLLRNLSENPTPILKNERADISYFLDAFGL
jgi:hypothetical protein